MGYVQVLKRDQLLPSSAGKGGIPRERWGFLPKSIPSDGSEGRDVPKDIGNYPKDLHFAVGIG